MVLKTVLFYLKLFFLISTVSSFAQTMDSTIAPTSDSIRQGPILEFAEVQPEFVGGLEAMNNFIRAHLRNPKSGIKYRIEGKVFVRFVVNTDGSLSNFESVMGLNAECEAEAIRVISIMPRWLPGKQDGKPVRVRFMVPVTFQY